MVVQWFVPPGGSVSSTWSEMYVEVETLQRVASSKVTDGDMYAAYVQARATCEGKLLRNASSRGVHTSPQHCNEAEPIRYKPLRKDAVHLVSLTLTNDRAIPGLMLRSSLAIFSKKARDAKRRNRRDRVREKML
eukprot:4929623-Amphidinium_carterae.1